jgi:glycosyltransferase involved in cell wall biosynthesis
VSVIIPVYNRETMVAMTIESVWAQSYPNLEIVAVDDASTDNTVAVLANLQKRSPVPMQVIRRETNGGMNSTYNAGVQASHGELLAFLDSDDLFLPGRFEAQVERLQRDPELMIVFGHGRELPPDGSIGTRVHPDETIALLSKPPAEILDHLYVNVTPMFLQSIVMRRPFFDAIGGFDETILSNDWVLMIRAFRALMSSGRSDYGDVECFLYRLHDGNLHKDLDLTPKLILQVFEKYRPPDRRSGAIAERRNVFASVAIEQDRPWMALKYLALGQRHRPGLRQLARTLPLYRAAVIRLIIPRSILGKLRRRIAAEQGNKRADS